MENKIEFYPEWRDNESHGVIAWAYWGINGEVIAEYPDGDFTPSLWFWNKHFADLGDPTPEEICMFDLQFGEGMYDKITGLSLYDYD